MARAKKRMDIDDLDHEEMLDFDDDEIEVRVSNRKEKFTVTVTIDIRATDVDIAQDIMSDIISSTLDKLPKRYSKDISIEDYDVGTEPAELD